MTSQATGAGIRQAVGDHLVAVGPQAGRKDMLWLFLPGTGGRPDQYSLFARRAAEAGFHVISLAYLNEFAVNRVCPGMGATCHEDMRTEIITGKDVSAAVNVDETNSIVNRLVSLLKYLDAQFPQEGWTAYLEGGAPRWESIRVGGHSQGGGHAAFMGKLFRLDRVVMFSATEPAPWTTRPGQTPPDRYYGFAHAREELFTPITRSWQNLGLTSPVLGIDRVEAPYQSAHFLSTSREVCRGDAAAIGYYHGCHILDDYTPVLEDGATPVYGDVWDYLLGP